MTIKFICGKNSVIDAIKNKYKILKIFSTFELNLNNKNIDIEIVDKKFLDNLTQLNHQGIVAIIENNYQYYSFDKLLSDKPNIVLILDHIEDVHNFGSILRTANAAGVFYIIIPDKRSADVNETVLRISSGGFINMKIAKVSSIQVAIQKLKEHSYWIYSSSLSQRSIEYNKINYNFPLALVVGNESKGISKTTEKSSDQLIYIPMNGTVQSLNVSIATGILLFELIKK